MAAKLSALRYSHHKVTVLAVAAVVSMAIAGPTHAASPVCVSSAEKEALDIRVLQTELMVAALSCQQHQEYNQFISSFQPMLKDNGKTLKILFRKTHGAGSKRALNTFVTGLANKASMASMKAWDGYCASTSALFKEALAAPSKDMATVASRPWMADRHGFRRCTATEKSQELNTAARGK